MKTTIRMAAWICAFTLLFTFSAPAPAHPGRGALNVWVASDSVKVKRDDPAGGASRIWSPGEGRITLKGARNEYLAFQIIVRADADLTGVTASVSDLAGPGATISRGSISLFREHYLNVTEPSTGMYGDPSSDGAGWYPDALLPFDSPEGAPFAVPYGQNQGVWVDLFIEKGMPAGSYLGAVTVTADGQTPVSIGLDVQVWDFSLPDESHMKTWFYFGQDELANGHHVAKYDEHYRALEQKYYRMARAHRVNIDAPVYFDYSGTGDGVTIDWESYHDELAAPLYDGTIYGDGRGMDPICLPVNEGNPYTEDHGGLYSAEYEATLKKMLQLVKQHFDERGWTPRTFLWMTDEPNDQEAYDKVRRFGQVINDSGTGFPMMETEQPAPDDPSWGSLVGYVDIWCAGSGSYVPAEMDARRAAGDRTWAYNGGRPGAGSQLIDTDGLGMRTWGWLAYKYSVECWLYWHCMYWKDIYNDAGATNDVWTDPLTFDQRRGGGPWPDWGNGDGTLFYPGYDMGIDGPVASQRMKALRRGLQDYEYMWLLGQQGKAGVARDAVDSVVRYGLGDADGREVGWSTEPDDWEAAREEMASQISKNDWDVKSTSYLAEGTTRDGFEEWVSILNPSESTANVALRYMLGNGENRTQSLAVGPRSRATINVNDFVGPEQDVSAVVTSDQDVIVERPVYFLYHGKWDGGHDVMGTRSKGRDWYLAEGTTRDGFEEWISILNPGEAAANVGVEYMLGTGETREQGLSVGAHSRATLSVNDFIGPEQDVSAHVTADQEIVVERPMYFLYHGRFDGGHDVMGATAGGKTWYLAEGTTRDGFEEWISIQNPADAPAAIEIEYATGDGERRTQSLLVGAHSRATVSANDFLGPGLDVSAVVTSNEDIIVERPMYFLYHGKWDGGHGVVGATARSRTWRLAEGTTREGFEEWISILNDSDETANVSITYMLGTGENSEQDIAVGPGSRATVSVNDFVGPEQDVSAVVTSDREIIVERPMYFLYHGKWDGGHDVMGCSE